MKFGATFLTRIIALVLIVVIVAVTLTAAINIYTIESTRGSVHTISQIKDSDTEVDAILVLGASVYADGKPSDILADRLEVAVDLYFAGVAPKIIVSGDNESLHYNESDAMKAYCEELGVPASAIIVDSKGVDTYASIYRAKYVYDAKSFVVVTQAYHLYRALMLAHILGVDSVIGVAADKGEYNNQRQYSIREIFARDKDFFKAILRMPA